MATPKPVSESNAFSDLTQEFIKQNLMGPNVVLMFNELCLSNSGSLAFSKDSHSSDKISTVSNSDSPASNALSPSARICDLGCGAGLSSLAIARVTDASVYAVDSWNAPEENRKRFDKFSFGNRIVAIQADAPDLPFEQGYFDDLICLDSYNYFGREEGVIDKIASYVKPGGKILLGISGVKHEPTPQDMKVFALSWTKEQMDYIKSLEWWRNLLSKSSAVRIDSIFEMDCHEQAWRDWLACDNEYAQGDRAACEAGAIDLMCTIGVALTRV